MSPPKKEKTHEEKQMEARTKAVALACEKLARWYIVNNQGKGPRELVELRKGSQMLRWCDPPLPAMDNPMLVEGFEGGLWTLRVEVLPRVS